MTECLHVVGARPNFMKCAPLVAALRELGVDQKLVHTGQHYDRNMSELFFSQLGLPEPDFNLGVGSGSHATQTGRIMIGLEEVLLAERPEWVIVYGDVNSTAAAALVATKLGIQLAHVEAGLRSFDRTMPEEINRIVTDALADLLLTPSEDANRNLAREGIPAEKIELVGNLMIDTLVRLLPEARRSASVAAEPRYILVTLHRPSNVDDPPWLAEIVGFLEDLAGSVPVVFPVHPRTRALLHSNGICGNGTRIRLIEPLGYLEFLALQRDAALVITDSGGVQEETTFLGVPCITVRENTERPITVEMGTNVLAGRNLLTIRRFVETALAARWKPGQRPPLWDGHAAPRAASAITKRRVRLS